MKQCLECKSDFDSKSANSKFCSVKCRVKHHRKTSVGKNGISVTQLQVIYNSILELVSNRNVELPKSLQAAIITSLPSNDIMFPFKETNVVKTPEEWVEEKREVPDGDIDAYKVWFDKLEACAYLTKHQKQQIKIT